MDYGKAVTFPTEDPDWLKKLGIGALVTAVPILNWAFTGYLVDLLRNVGRGEPRPLPDWSDFGEKFMKGLLLSIAGFIYMLPAFLIMCIGGVAIGALGSAQSGNAQDVMATAFSGVGIILSCCILIYVLAISFLLPAVMIHFARQGTFSSCFQFSEIWKYISSDMSGYLTAWVVSVVIFFIIAVVAGLISAVLGIIPCIGWILGWLISAVGAAWGLVSVTHLFGQFGAKYLA
jgi:hypothetical protein